MHLSEATVVNLNIQTVTIALAPAFGVGVGIQHLNELLDALFSTLSGSNTNLKKLLMGFSSLIFGCIATVAFKLDIVGALGGVASTDAAWVLNVFVTALIISTGTEGINSIVKFLGYAKDQKKATAGSSEASAGPSALGLVNREP